MEATLGTGNTKTLAAAIASSVANSPHLPALRELMALETSEKPQRASECFFVAKFSEVYHTTSRCSALKWVGIRMVSQEEVEWRGLTRCKRCHDGKGS